MSDRRRSTPSSGGRDLTREPLLTEADDDDSVAGYYSSADERGATAPPWADFRHNDEFLPPPAEGEWPSPDEAEDGDGDSEPYASDPDPLADRFDAEPIHPLDDVQGLGGTVDSLLPPSGAPVQGYASDTMGARSRLPPSRHPMLLGMGPRAAGVSVSRRATANRRAIGYSSGGDYRGKGPREAKALRPYRMPQRMEESDEVERRCTVYCCALSLDVVKLAQAQPTGHICTFYKDGINRVLHTTRQSPNFLGAGNDRPPQAVSPPSTPMGGIPSNLAPRQRLPTAHAAPAAAAPAAPAPPASAAPAGGAAPSAASSLAGERKPIMIAPACRPPPPIRIASGGANAASLAHPAPAVPSPSADQPPPACAFPITADAASAAVSQDSSHRTFIRPNRSPVRTSSAATAAAAAAAALGTVLDAEAEAEEEHAFFFSYGCVVFWGFNEDDEERITAQAKANFALQPLAKDEVDDFDYAYTLPGTTRPALHKDVIQLSTREATEKLAVSFALAQSAKLGVFETTIEKTIAETREIPERMARTGKISLKRRDITQRIGQLFVDRASINLHSDILEDPDFFWEDDEYLSVYQRVAKYLEVESRVEVLNKRLDLIKELFDMLASELHNSHSNTLEWIVIILIVVEVLFQVLELFVLDGFGGGSSAG